MVIVAVADQPAKTLRSQVFPVTLPGKVQSRDKRALTAAPFQEPCVPAGHPGPGFPAIGLCIPLLIPKVDLG